MRHHNGTYKDCWPGGVAEKSTPLDLSLFLLLLLSLLVGSVPPDLLLEAMNSTALIGTPSSPKVEMEEVEVCVCGE